MDADTDEKVPVESEEPHPGWLRYEVEGSTPYYKSPVPRTVLRSARKLAQYLDIEHKKGNLLNVAVSDFSFKRRLGLKSSKRGLTSYVASNKDVVSCVKSSYELSVTDSRVSEGDDGKRNQLIVCKSTSIVHRLSRSTEIVDHRKVLSAAAKNLDCSRVNDGYLTPDNFEEIKSFISSSEDLREMLSRMSSEEKVSNALDLMMVDACLSEISCIDMTVGPLVEFPNNINENIYANIANYGIERCPRLMHFIIDIVVRRGEPVLPSHVLKISNLFSTLCYAANRELDALIKLRSLTLQVDGLSNIGLDILSDAGLTQCARSLSNHRDMFAEVGPQVVDATACLLPYQSTIDNCDFQQEHLTIEIVEKETISTSELCTIKKSKDAALAMFDKKLVLLSSEENLEEREHLLKVIALEAAKLLAAARPSASVFRKHLPRHHHHKNAEKKLSPALAFIIKPYPYQVS